VRPAEWGLWDGIPVTTIGPSVGRDERDSSRRRREGRKSFSRPRFKGAWTAIIRWRCDNGLEGPGNFCSPEAGLVGPREHEPSARKTQEANFGSGQELSIGGVSFARNLPCC